MADHTNYVLSCCSTCDLSEKHLRKRDISYIYFNYYLNDVPYKDDFGHSNTPTEIYNRMLAGEPAKTSQVSVGDYVEHFRSILSEGKDVLHVCLSSGISGTYNSALDARTYLMREFPDRDIAIVDSLCASAGYGLLMDKLADLRDEGKPMNDVLDFIYANRLLVNTRFFVSDLKFLVMGGRVSKASGAIGGLLKICPILQLDVDGKLSTLEKVRTKKRAIKRIVDIMEEHAQGGAAYNGKCYIAQTECLEDARAVADEIEDRFPNLAEPVSIYDVGATIGCHLGPGAVVVNFWGDRRLDNAPRTTGKPKRK